MLSSAPQSNESPDQSSFTKKNCSLSSLSTTSDFSSQLPVISTVVVKESVDSLTYSPCNNFLSIPVKVDIESQLSLSPRRACSVLVQQNSQQLSYYHDSIARVKINRTNSSYKNVNDGIRISAN